MEDSNAVEEREYLEGERGPATVPLWKLRKSSMIAFTSIVLLSVAAASIAYMALIRHHKAPEVNAGELVTNEAAVPQKTFLPAPPAPPAAGPPDRTGPQVLAGPNDKPGPEDELYAKRLASPLMHGQALAPTGATATRQQEPVTDVAGPPKPGTLASHLQPTETPARAAAVIADRNLTIAKGTFIDCALETRVASDVPGMTSCVVTRNIYGDNGKVVLIERGSKLTGEYQGGMQQGQARIFVLWSRVKTPHGVVVNLDSPGTDALGGGGMPGYVDNHFGQRFGGAILLSVISDGLLIGGNLASRAVDNQTIVYNNTASNANQMAAEALRNTINIPPTLYKNQGERINVIVARDLSFEGVYDVKLR
ncbi:MAG: Type IV secretion system protein virB10 [Syntrophorhabdaceae bacterium PtaU1.Bin034]|nr:MAG: Type IV secretion system protein virB10 [Syntrophorhabdaceae bacterium PtaU1.Bin034]